MVSPSDMGHRERKYGDADSTIHISCPILSTITEPGVLSSPSTLKYQIRYLFRALLLYLVMNICRLTRRMAPALAMGKRKSLSHMSICNWRPSFLGYCPQSGVLLSCHVLPASEGWSSNLSEDELRTGNKDIKNELPLGSDHSSIGCAPVWPGQQLPIKGEVWMERQRNHRETHRNSEDPVHLKMHMPSS